MTDKIAINVPFNKTRLHFDYVHVVPWQKTLLFASLTIILLNNANIFFFIFLIYNKFFLQLLHYDFFHFWQYFLPSFQEPAPCFNWKFSPVWQTSPFWLTCVHIFLFDKWHFPSTTKLNFPQLSTDILIRIKEMSFMSIFLS